MWSIISTIFVGLIVGIIAKFLMPGDNEPKGFIMTAILGIVGAYVGTFIGQAVLNYEPGQFAGWPMSIVGAIVVLVIYGMVVKKKQA